MEYVISLVLISLSALFSGLTLGLMGLDVHELKRKAKLGNKDAEKVLPLRENGNLLLSTLLLGNVAVNAALSIFLGSIATGVIAGILATVLIFLFGEIIPQAVISRHALSFGARSAFIVTIVLYLFYPLTKPIAWGLDKLLGEELPTVYSKKELMHVIEEHEDSHHSKIDEDEERILKGALTFSDKSAKQVMTPAPVMVMVEQSEVLNPKLLKKLRNSGHSRFPVFEEDEDQIVGILYLRNLVGAEEGKSVGDLMEKTVYYVSPEEKLDEVLNAFLKTRHHLFIVSDEFGDIEGLITVEDILEEIVGQEIVDEFDKHEDMRQVAKRRSATKMKKAI